MNCLIPSLLLACAALAAPAHAQRNPASSYAGDFERPYGFAYGEETSPFEANTRDANGNRLVVDGRIMSDTSSLSWSGAGASAWASASASASAGVSGGYAQGSAIGNQINVITQGNWNTVIVNASQTNTGDQTTNLNGGVLNGQVNLDD